MMHDIRVVSGAARTFDFVVVVVVNVQKYQKMY